MQVESPDLDKQALVNLLQTDYGLDVARLEFVPKGEESHSYIVTTPAGHRYFVKVHMVSISPGLEACYRFVHHLYAHEHCQWVVAPHVTRAGNCLTTLGDRAVVVFDHVIGGAKSPGELTSHQATYFAGQLVTLHRAVAAARMYGVPTETFAISFKSWLLEVLQATEQPLRTTHAWIQAAYTAIRNEKSQLLNILAETETIGAELRAADLPLAVTHGDLASYNIIQDGQDNLLLIDWGKLCLASVARDLVDLWDKGNAGLLAAYFHTLDMPIAKLQQTLTYYFQYNLLATVTDYGSWLLLEDASPEEVANAWRGLQHVLPVDLTKLSATVAAICAIAAHPDGKVEHDE